jgi:cellulose synthase/poly-beta-1,6-N-acetylglucosamine synthase-like glycosyltransferase
MYFQNPEIMAVAPSIKLWNPKSPLELLQKIEYSFGIFTRKMFHFMRAIYITPGPFSIFRKEVFEKLGGYKHAHNTEDIELALRMQKNSMRIAHAHNAFVYTVPPKTIKTLLKQRVRWSYGFIKNAQDYKDMFFKPQYGNVGILVLPMAAISVISILFMSSLSVISIIKSIANEIIRLHTIGFRFNFHFFTFDWFYINTQILSIMAVFTTLGTLFMIIVSKHLSEGKVSIGMDLIYFMTLYMFIAPLWIGKAAYNALFRVKTTWR